MDYYLYSKNQQDKTLYMAAHYKKALGACITDALMQDETGVYIKSFATVAARNDYVQGLMDGINTANAGDDIRVDIWERTETTILSDTDTRNPQWSDNA